jgi:hypothetical protein
VLCNIFQYFVEAGAIAVRRVRKEDLRHVAKATGATMVCLHDKIVRLRVWGGGGGGVTELQFLRFLKSNTEDCLMKC